MNSQELTSQYSTWFGQSLSDFPAFSSGRGGRHMTSSFTGSVCACCNLKQQQQQQQNLVTIQNLTNTCLILIPLLLNTYWDKVTACGYLHQDNGIARDIYIYIRKEQLISIHPQHFEFCFRRHQDVHTGCCVSSGVCLGDNSV